MSDTDIAPNSDIAKGIYFWGGEKGGVGKSFACRCMLDYFHERQWGNEFLFVEADPVIEDVGSIYNNNCETVVFSDNKFDRDEPNIIIDKVVEKTIIVNLPSNVSRQFDYWTKNTGLLSSDVRQYCSEIVYFFVTDGCYQSIEQFLNHLKKYSDKGFKHCLVFNPGRLTCGGNFSYLEKFKPLMKAIKENNIPVLELPELSSNMQFDCDRQQMSYRNLLAVSTKITTRRNIQNFLDRVDRLFEQIYPKTIHQPSGLTKLVEEQKDYRQKNQLAFLHSEGVIS